MVNLTGREWQVLRAMSLGKTSSEIAAELGISGWTVKDHRKTIHRKLDARNGHHAVAIGIQTGMLP